MVESNFDELPDNPVKKLRLAKGLNHAVLARESKLTVPTIRDVEKGLLPELPFQLEQFFDVQSDENTLSVQYMDWKVLKRSCTFLPPVGLLSVSSDTHPFKQYRNKLGISIAKLAELLCVPRFVLNLYETNQKSMPKSLQLYALPQAHLSKEDVARLANLGVVYFENKQRRKISEQQQNYG